MKGEPENVVFIDVDSCENVIIIDAPDAVEKDMQGSSASKGERRFPSPGVISIDDDDDEIDIVDDPEICAKCGVDLDSDSSSSKSCPHPDFMRRTGGLDDDECRVVQGKRTKFKLSKCKKTYTGKTPCGKRFGLGPDSEDSSSESDWSDCELMEGSAGKLREQWEEAFRKRNNARNVQSGSEDQTSASGSHSNTSPTVKEETRTKQCAETPVSCGLRSSNTQKQSSSAFETSAGKYSGRASVNHEVESPFVASDKKVNDESFSPSKYGATFQARYSNVQEADLKKDPARSGDGEEEFYREPSNSDPYPSDLHPGKMDAIGKEKLQPEEPSMSNPKLSEEPSMSNPKLSEEPSMLHTAPASTSKEDDEMDASEAQGSGATDSGEKDVIIDREKLKETDEYKRALEEELASRQCALRIQAEEAQRLRKRRKAESMRLLDMERRQKQRLEEMRETQKKDQENMDLKEQLRAEVRKELSKLELSCIDMASLLRSLGIPVGGGFGPFPQSQEVHAAYKKALLKFHPDRASKTDIRQQVEAEEKFKLISRMKDKFLATLCH